MISNWNLLKTMKFCYKYHWICAKSTTLTLKTILSCTMQHLGWKTSSKNRSEIQTTLTENTVWDFFFQIRQKRDYRSNWWKVIHGSCWKELRTVTRIVSFIAISNLKIYWSIGEGASNLPILAWREHLAFLFECSLTKSLRSTTDRRKFYSAQSTTQLQ